MNTYEINKTFINFGVEELLDMRDLNKTEFLTKYPHLTEADYSKIEEAVKSLGGFGVYKFSEKIFDILYENNPEIFRMAVLELMAKGVNYYQSVSYGELRKTVVENEVVPQKVAIDIFVTAKHLSRCLQINLLHYISKNIDYHVGDTAPSYRRAIEIAGDAIENATEYLFEYNGTEEGIDKMRYDLHLDDDEIEFFGYGWALDEEYDEN